MTVYLPILVQETPAYTSRPALIVRVSVRVTGTLQVCYLARPAVASRPVTQRRKNVPEIHKLVSSRS
jgi:hypothetical protein